MPARLRHSTTGGESAKENHYSIPGLEFNEPLSWRAGKAIPVADLLARLEKLAGELRRYEAEEVDSIHFQTLAKDLTNSNLLGHKDKGVRAWTVICVVDILKICAPDAPLLEGQLKDVFNVFINSILPNLADSNHAYHSQHLYILTSVAESQSILLITDVAGADTLLVPLFTICFDLVSGSSKHGSHTAVSKTIEFHLQAMLLAVVEEIPLSPEVTDVVISQFMRVDARSATEHSNKTKKNTNGQDSKQQTLLLKDYPPAYNMAKAVCTSSAEKMAVQMTQYSGNIIQYFGTIVADAARLTSTGNGETKAHQRRVADDDESDDESEPLAELRKVHRLLRELWRACPDVIVNVFPQIEIELSSDSPILRQLATETLGDITAGVGIAGLPPASPLDPCAYPLPSIDENVQPSTDTNPLLQSASPKPFQNVYASVYRALQGRRHDKDVSVRCAWVSAAAKILYTRAGGTGLNDDEKSDLLKGISQMLQDHEERVRVAAIHSLDRFGYHAVIDILGSDGGLSKPATVLSVLADRVTDRKHQVREEAVELLARMWGVASRDIEAGNETVVRILGLIPSKLLGAYFTNDLHIHALLDEALYEYLLPLSYPPTKAQPNKRSSTKATGNNTQTTPVEDPDMVRVQRILTFIRSLDSKSRPVFFGMQNRQVQMQRGMTIFLKACEEYNGGVFEEDVDGDKVKSRLTSYIEALSKTYPEPTKMTTDLWRFAKLHDRRAYQLIRFAISPEHDYRTMIKAVKELGKRIREGPANTQSLMESLMPLLYRCALVIYNRSHVPAVMEISTTAEQAVADVAHEVLKEISTRNPEVLKTHIQTLCKDLEENAPTAAKTESPSAADTMKACAHFARQYPKEVPQDRKFLSALTNFAIHSRSPKAAKHAVSIIMAVADKREMYAKDVLAKSLKECIPKIPQYLGRLASISQICLLAPAIAGNEADAILHLAVDETLHKNHSPAEDYQNTAWDAEPDSETQAKELALKVLVNRCRSEPETDDFSEFDQLGKTVLELLLSIIKHEGEITPAKDTPSTQRNHLRLTAVRLVAKLCAHKRRMEDLVTPQMFIEFSTVIVNPPIQVRAGFINQLKKYIGQNKLNHRWITVLFLLAFEPDIELKLSTITWLKSRGQYFIRQRQQAVAKGKKNTSNVMELTFARLLSLLAHHPDYPQGEGEEFEGELLDFAKYLVFYLVSVATEDNMSLVFHVAQRVKQTQDAVTSSDEINERLYVLSDLAQAVIRNYVDLLPSHGKGNNLLQTWPGTVSLPRSLFKALPSHDVAQSVAEKNYLPEEVAAGLEKLVRTYIKSCKHTAQAIRRVNTADRKRKSDSMEPEEAGADDEEERPTKRPKRKALPIRRTPKAKKIKEPPSSEAPSRKSARVSTTNAVSYAEGDSEDDDAEMEEFDKLTSSPAAARVGRASTKPKPVSPVANSTSTGSADEDEDEDAEPEASEIEDEQANKTDKDQTEQTDMHVHEDEADPDDAIETTSEHEKSPPPLKEARNLRTKKKAAGSPNTKSPPLKKGRSKVESPIATRRQTRRTKA